MSIGVPVFNTDVRIVTDAGHDAAPREIGELVIAGPQIIPGYWQKPKETAASLARRRAAHRRRRLHGRAGLVLPRRSRQGHDRGVGLQGVAARGRGGAVSAPAVREAAVIGIADPYRGETIKAVISLKAGHTRHRRTRSRRSRASGWPPTSTRASWRSSTTCRRRPAARSCAGCCRPRRSTRAQPLRGPELELVSVSYPQLRAARRSARACSRSAPSGCDSAAVAIPRSTSEALYERLRAMLAQLDDSGRFLDRDALLERKRGLSRRRHRPRRERAPVARVPPPAAARAADVGAEGHAGARRTRRVAARAPDRLDRRERCRRRRQGDPVVGRGVARQHPRRRSAARSRRDDDLLTPGQHRRRPVDRAGQGAEQPRRRRRRAGAGARRARGARDRHHADARRVADRSSPSAKRW